MRMPALILTVTAATLLSASAGAQDKANPPKEQVQESAKRVKELRKERIAVLQEMTDQLTRLYQNGRVEIDALLEARVQLFQARLDAAEKQSDRLTLYKALVEELGQYEKTTQGRIEAGRGSMASVLKARARRLAAEIHLEEAKVGNSDGKRQKPLASSPQVKDVTITQQYVCQILAQRHIKIRALQKGYVEAIRVKEGQAVKQGDVVFKVVPVLYKAKLDAELAEARLAQLELQNAERLFKDKVVSQNEVERVQAKLSKAQAKVKVAEIELNFTEVRAPFDGIIDRLHQQQGSLITERDIFTTLSDNSAMWVYFNVPEARYLEYMAGAAKEKEGAIELVLADSSKFKQGGKVSAIEADFNSGTGTIPFRADFPNPDRLLRHGMTGNVLMHRTLHDAVVIPQRATFEILDKRYVYVLDKEGVAHRREVIVQDEQGDFFVIHRGKVGGDDRIIVEGAHQIRDGEQVEYEFRPPGQIPGHQNTRNNNH